MKPQVGVSACLLGEPVRYDGGHKLEAGLVEAFRGRVEWVPVCPEVEIGLGVPRATIQLEAAGADVRLISSDTRRDLTQTMRNWAAARLEALALAGLDGYLLKARSPSCGLGSTPVAGREETRDGLFAESLRARFPDLPLIDEDAASNPAGQSKFLRLANAHRDLRQLFEPGWIRGQVVEFHTRRKLLLLAHSPHAYAELGALVGCIAKLTRRDFQRAYVPGYLEAIAEDPTPGRHANALSHAAGYFSQELPPAERAALAFAIERVGAGELSELPQVKAGILVHAGEYLRQQLYLTECELN